MISYIILIALSLITISGFSLSAGKSLFRQMENSRYQAVQQMNVNLDNCLNKVEGIITQVLTNKQIQDFIYRRQPFTSKEHYDAYLVSTQLQSMMTSQDFVEEIYIYYPNSDLVITNHNVLTPTLYFSGNDYGEYSLEAWLDEMKLFHNHSYYFGSESAEIYPHSGYLYVVQSISLNHIDQQYANLVILVRRDLLNEAVDEALGNNAAQITVRNAGDEIIASSFQQPTVGIEQDVFVETSPTLNFTYEYAFSGLKLSGSISDYYITSLLVIIGWLAISIPIAYVLSHKNYNPIQKLLNILSSENYENSSSQDEFRHIEDSMLQILKDNRGNASKLQNILPIYRNILLEKCLQSENMTSDMQEEWERYGIEFPEKNYFLILVRLNSPNPCHSTKVVSITSYTAIHLMKQRFSTIGYVEVVNTSEGEFTAIVNYSPQKEKEVFEYCQKILPEINEQISEGSAIPTQMIVSGSCEGLQNVKKIRDQMTSFLKFGIWNPSQTLIYLPPLDSEETDFDYTGFTEAAQGKLLSHIKQGDMDGTTKVLDELFAGWNQQGTFSISGYKCLCFNIICGITKITCQSSLKSEEVFGSSDAFHTIDQLSTAKEIRDFLYTSCIKLCRLISGIRSVGSSSIVHNAEVYIEENYQDQNLNVNSLSYRLGITPPYLSTLFKNEHHQNISDYITEVRVRNAKKMLEETDETIVNVAKKTGFNSDISFIRVFKKVVGMTPGTYRTEKRKE
jgi:two-component system response regulator YesN